VVPAVLTLTVSPTNQPSPACSCSQDCTLTSYSEPPAAAQQKTKQKKRQIKKEIQKEIYNTSVLSDRAPSLGRGKKREGIQGKLGRFEPVRILTLNPHLACSCSLVCLPG